MRPLKLQLTGFTCFKDPTILEFDSLELYAIEGQTGSGKSSLLDAICFALYGQTPRLGAKGLDVLISSGEARLVVDLEFESGGERFQVVRSRGRKQSQNEMRFNRLKGGAVSGDHKKKDVQAEIEKVLGLSFDSFKRAILLPQGEFDGFLRGTGKVRQELLGNLIGLEHFSKMHAWASSKSRTLESEQKNISHLLDTEYSSVTLEVRGQLEEQLQQVKSQLEAGRGGRGTLEGQLAEQKALQLLEGRNVQAHSELQKLQNQAGEIKELEARLEQAAKVAQVLPLLASVENSENKSLEAQKVLQHSLEQYQLGQKDLQTAQNKLEVAQNRSLEIPALREQVSKLGAAEHDEARLKALNTKISYSHPEPLPWDEKQFEEARSVAQTALQLAQEKTLLLAQHSQLEALERTVIQNQEQQKQLGQELHTVQEQLERERYALEPVQLQHSQLQQVSSLAQRMKVLKLSADLSHPELLAWDEEHYQEIREVLRQRTTLQAEELAWHKSEQALEEQQHQLEGLGHQQNAAEQRFNQSLMDWQQAVRLESNSKAALEAAQLRDLAHGLRYSLRLGEACPVCEQKVNQLPHSQSGVLDQAQQKFKQAEQARILLEKQNRDIEKELTQLQAHYHNEKNNFAAQQIRLEQEKIRLDQVRASLDPQATLERLRRLEAALVQQVRQVVGQQTFEMALERNQSELKRLEKVLEVGQKQKFALEGQWGLLQGSLQSDSQHLSEGKTALEAAGQNWKARKAALGEREADLEMNRLLAGLALRLRQITGGKPLGLLRSSLNNQIQHLQSDLEEATLAHSQAMQLEQSAKNAWQYAQKHSQDLHSQHSDVQEALERALTPLNLTRADLRDQALEPHKTQQFEQRIQKWQQAHQLVLSQLKTLEAEWQGRSYHPRLHSDLQNQLTELSLTLERLTAQQGALLERHSRLAHDLQSKTDLERKRGELSRSFDVYKSLDNALRSDGFPKYLLEELENGLLRQGSELLLELSDGRYRLALEDGEYMVVDDWNAGISRGVKTLSGGETFLASLSLAISLSDYLAGNKRLGALFLDEGFGTLDSEALEAVTKALEHLQSSGRMVGVITHVSSLAERLPSRVRVFKHSQGSRLEVEA